MPKKSYSVVAALLFDKDGRILITQRPAGAHLEGYWEFPGGTIEDNESAEEALLREIKEEINLDIKVNKLFWRERFDYDVKIIDIRFYFCEISHKTQQITPLQVADFRWVNLAELQNYSFPPADQALVKRLRDFSFTRD